ncbi:MAG: ATP-binding protein [Candidatus Sumerlaeia bacterium]
MYQLEGKYQELLTTEENAVILVDTNHWTILDVNPMAEKMYGFSRRDLLRMGVRELAANPSFMEEALVKRQIIISEITNRRKSGEEFPVQAICNYFRVNAEDLMIMIVIDLESRRKAEEEIRRYQLQLETSNRVSQAFLTTLDDAVFQEVLEILQEALGSPIGFFGYIDEEGQLVCPSMSEGVYDQCDMEDRSLVFPPDSWAGIWGRSLREKKALLSNGSLHPPEGRLPLERAIVAPLLHQDQLVGQFCLANASRDYSEEDLRFLENIANQVAPVLYMRLETMRYNREREMQMQERVALEEQLRQAQKMEAIGTLAGGIAHDFNNILSAVLGYADLAFQDTKGNTDARSSISEVLKAGRRARDLVGQILAFSRQTEQEKRPLRLQPLLKEAVKLLRGSIPSTIDIHMDISRDCGTVMADPTGIHQIVMNLCTNAYQAMAEFAQHPDRSKRNCKLELSLKQKYVGEKEAEEHIDLSSRAYAVLTIQDTGKGMSPELLSKIFVPYFTTKQKEEGTGLGLSVVHSIVKAHDGAITVSSAPDKGSRFDIYLPLSEKPQQAAPVSGKNSLPVGTETILLVDDEEPIIQVGRLSLERLGYKVTAAESGPEALEYFGANPEKYDVVITDLTMPRMTGLELAEKLLAIRPDIPIILCTGFSEAVTPEDIRAAGIREISLKPIIARKLAQTIREIVDSPEKVSS